MSGRIRTIKPEILDDDKTARLSDRAWRIFVSTFALADDYGNLRGSPEWISAQSLWAFGLPAIDQEMGELFRAGLLTEYEVAGQTYVHITNWAKHQRVDRPGAPRVPRPEGVQDLSVDADGQPLDTAVTYIARRGTDGPIKIGFSIDPVARAAQLSKQHPEKVRILATMPGRKHEKALHRKFEHIRIEGSEWFEPHEDLLAFIDGLSTDCPMPVQCPSIESNARPMPVQCPSIESNACPMPRARAQDHDHDHGITDHGITDHGITDHDHPREVMVIKFDDAPQVDTGKVPCPHDLQLLPEQQATLACSLQVPDWAIAASTVRFVASSQGDPSDLRTLAAWRKCLSRAVAGDWNDPRRRREMTDAHNGVSSQKTRGKGKDSPLEIAARLRANGRHGS